MAICRQVSILLLVICAVLTGPGCTRRIIDFTVISTKNVDLSRMGEYYRYDRRVSGKHSCATCFGGTLFGEPDMKTAMDRAIQRVPNAVALVDGVVYERNWSFLDLFGGKSIIVEGTPLIDTKTVSPKK